MSKTQLIAEKNSKTRESAATKAKIADLNAKIEKAKRIKSKLEDLKKDVTVHKYSASFILKEYNYWKGDNNSKRVDKSKSDLIDGSLRDCINNIDDNIDRLIDKITEMENEVNDLEGTLSWLKNAINSLIAAIEKIAN